MGNGETQDWSMFRSFAEHSLADKVALRAFSGEEFHSRSFEQIPGCVVALLTAKFEPSDCQLSSTHPASHAARSLLHCIRAAGAAWCKFNKRLTSCLHWAGDCTYGNQKMAIRGSCLQEAERFSIDEKRRKE